MLDLHERFQEYDTVAVPELWDRVSDLAATAPIRPQRKWRRLVVALAAAAIVLLAVGGPLLLIASRDSAEVTEPADTVVPLEWSRGGEGGAAMSSITAGGPGFVAVGTTGDGVGEGWGVRNAAVWTSPDGITWTRVPHDPEVFGGDGDQEMVSVAAAGPGLVAVGYRFDEPELPGAFASIWTSPDGHSWSPVPYDPRYFTGERGNMSDVVAGGPGVVAVGSDGSAAVWTSGDGLVWSRVPDNPSVFGPSVMSSVVAGGPGLVAVGQSPFDAGTQSNDGVTLTHNAGSSHGIVWTSVDGFEWSRVLHDEAVFGGAPGEHCRMEDLAAGNDGLIAVGACELFTVDGEDGLVAHGDRTVIWTSADGYVWSRVPDEMLFPPDPEIDPDQSAYWDLLPIDGGLLAIGPNATWSSSDGHTWTRIADHGIDGANDVITTPSGFIAVGGSENEHGNAVAAVSIAAPGG